MERLIRDTVSIRHILRKSNYEMTVTGKICRMLLHIACNFPCNQVVWHTAYVSVQVGYSGCTIELESFASLNVSAACCPLDLQHSL
jgi:hypothetical protein